VTASQGGKVLLSMGVVKIARDSQGHLLPQLRNAQTGKIVEIMKGASNATRIAKMAALSSAVVGAAHIIASADIAKRLKILDSKVDALLAYRQIDQVVTLERIYTSAKELAFGLLDEHKRLEL
jgi:hypothetical protein